MKKFNCYLICLFFYIELWVELTYFNTSQYMLCLPSITFDIIQITCKQRQVFNDSRVTHTACTMCAIGKLASCYHSHIILTITVILFLCYWIWCAKFIHKAKVHQFKLSFFKIISLFALLINFTYFFHGLFWNWIWVFILWVEKPTKEEFWRLISEYRLSANRTLEHRWGVLVCSWSDLCVWDDWRFPFSIT